MRTGETAHVSIDSITLDGEGIATLQGRELLCRGVFPSERAEVRIEALSRHHPRAHARLQMLEQPHAARRPAPCRDHESRGGRCTGCALMPLDEAAQRDVKRQMLRERFGLDVAHIISAPAALGYRYASKRVVLSRRGIPYLGSFAHGSHEPAAMSNCLVDHPRLRSAFAAVEACLRTSSLTAYNERTAQGDLRYILGKTNGHEEIITLVSARPDVRVHELVPALSDAVAGVLHSVQMSRGNSVRGETAELLHGVSEVSLSLLDTQIEVGALGFLQPNPSVAEQAYRCLTTLPTDGTHNMAFDLYAGTGVTTRILRSHFAEVYACEAHPESAAALEIAPEHVEHFLARQLEAQPTQTPDLVIANPPRKGLGNEVCRQLLTLAAPALHLMSCGPAGLARDLSILKERYTLDTLEAFDTLPQTPHVELVAKLSLRRNETTAVPSAQGCSKGGC